jgi:putative transposase
MRIRSAIVRGAYSLTRLEIELSREAKRRLEWFDYYSAHHKNARLTCRHFDISPQTFYRWLKRYNPNHPRTLESRSHRPKKVRQPEYSEELVSVVLKLRNQYPRWGKDKLAVLAAREGCRASASTIGRILSLLKKKGRLIEPISNYISARKRSRLRPYAVRKPKEYQAKQPGDIVELDTLDIRPLPGVLLKHFTAYDVVSKWNVLSVASQATAATAAHFLEALISRTPYPIKAIQVDGGSEFEAVFETECQNRGIKLFVLPPRSPKLNGAVERANRTHTEEFYEVTDSTFELADLRPKLLEWEKICNTCRPNQALNYLTPLEFLEKLQHQEAMCH